MNTKTIFEASGANYTTTKVEAKGNIWAITVTTGRFNYITVRKVTNNPYKGPGRRFDNFNEAQTAYKCEALKMQLILLETGLI